MKNIFLLLCMAVIMACNNQKKPGRIQSVTALTEVFGDGQKTTAAIVEYTEEIKNEKLDKKTFSVEGRTITKIYPNDKPEKSATGKNGKYIIIEMSKDDEQAATFIANGRNSEIKEAHATVRQLNKIETASGSSIEPTGNSVNSSKAINLIVDDFTQHQFKDPNTGITVHYNLYTPKNYDKNKSYPMVMFIHDAGVVSTETKATLIQGLGAVIWASPEEQAKHECFVLAPQYSVVTVNDQSEYTKDLDATVHLINDLTKQYNIDKNRLYTTGQSMGCMSSIALDIKYPDLFAASFLVAGQWDPSKVAPMANDNLWIIVSQGDDKAFPGMNAITAALEKQGAKITRSVINGKATPQELAEDVKNILAKGNKIQYTPLKAGTVVPPDMQGQGGSDHRATWRIAYTFEGVRDWLFKQKK